MAAWFLSFIDAKKVLLNEEWFTLTASRWILQALYHLLHPNTLQSTHQTHTSEMPGQANH